MAIRTVYFWRPRISHLSLKCKSHTQCQAIRLPSPQNRLELGRKKLLSQNFSLPFPLWPVFYPSSLLPYLFLPHFSCGCLWGWWWRKWRRSNCVMFQRRCLGAEMKSLRSLPLAPWWGLDLQKGWVISCPCELAFIYLFSGLFPNTGIGFYAQRVTIFLACCWALTLIPYVILLNSLGKMFYLSNLHSTPNPMT